MDRLPPVTARAAIAAALLLAACGGGGPAPAPSRYDAVRSAPGRTQTKQWCDALFPAESGPVLEIPPLSPALPGGVTPRLAPGRWTWINVWATWCVPCRRELPLLTRWRHRLVEAGVPIDLWFLSVDEKADDVRQFVSASPDVAGAAVARLGGVGPLARWLAPTLGAAPDSIPIQLIVTPAGRLRCARVGTVDDGDWSAVRDLLR